MLKQTVIRKESSHCSEPDFETIYNNIFSESLELLQSYILGET